MDKNRGNRPGKNNPKDGKKTGVKNKLATPDEVLIDEDLEQVDIVGIGTPTAPPPKRQAKPEKKYPSYYDVEGDPEPFTGSDTY